jgi:hypothetical protein
MAAKKRNHLQKGKKKVNYEVPLCSLEEALGLNCQHLNQPGGERRNLILQKQKSRKL